MVQGFTLLGIHPIPEQDATPVLVNEDSFRFLLLESEPDSYNCFRAYPYPCTNHLFMRNLFVTGPCRGKIVEKVRT